MAAVNVKAKEEASEDKDGFHKFYYTTLFDRSSVTAAKGDDMTPCSSNRIHSPSLSLLHYYTTLFDRSSVTAAKGNMTPLILDRREPPYTFTLSHC